MTCRNCNEFLPFGENKGLPDVDGDGQCTLAGKNNPEQWQMKYNTDSCTADTSTKTPEPLKINLNTRQILDNAKSDIEARRVRGHCGQCSSWRRKGFSDDGECWAPGAAAQNSLASTDSCPRFYARPDGKAQIGDIVEILVGDQWQILYAGKKHVFCADKNGDEQVFDLKGLRFKKC